MTGEAKTLQEEDVLICDVELPPPDSVLSGSRVGVVGVVPTLTERERSDPPVVPRTVGSLKQSVSPTVSGGVDEPRGVVHQDQSKGDAPEDSSPATDEV